MRDGLWQDGVERLASALAEAERSELEPLESALAAESEPARRAELERRIAEVRTRYRRQWDVSKDSLF